MHPPVTERLPTPVYTARAGLPWSDTWKLHPLFDQLAFRAGLLLVGPKGTGKTLAFQSWAAGNRCPVVTFDCSEDVRRSHLLGMYVLRGNETPYVLGPLTTALEIANEVGRCLLVLEELNALTPQMQKVLNPLTDFRRRLEVPECGRVFELQPGAQLWVVGTLNTTSYGGVYALNEDLKSRFRMLQLDYPSPEAERALLATHFPGGLDDALVKKVLLLAQETRQNALDYALSPRDVVQLLGDTGTVGLRQALRLVLGKFEGADAEMVRQRIHSIFHLKLDKEP